MNQPGFEIDWRRRGRLSAEKRERLKGEMVPLVAAGMSARAIAQELGVHQHTVQRWRNELVGKGGFRAVEIASPDSARQSPVLVTPSGFRVEGLSLEQLALLLRGLQ